MILEWLGRPEAAAPTRPDPALEALLLDAERCIAEHGDAAPVGGLVNGNPRLVACALQRIADQRRAAGMRFCEWGSGLGAATCIASALGFAASGIEIDASLVAKAQALAARHELDASFRHGSYLDLCAGDAWAAVDVVHVYPWPAEARRVEQLFLQWAPADAMLLSSYGPAEVRLHRKSDLDGSGRYAARRAVPPA